MNKKSLSLQTKITILIIIVVLASLFSTAGLIIRWAVNNLQEKAETNIMNVAEIVANTESITDALDKKDPEAFIKVQIDSIFNSVEQVDFIVVTDMNRIRYSHPVASRIGQEFVGGDEERVIEKGERYISEAVGTLGKSLRAFVPLYNNQNEQIGFVVVGTLTKSIDEAKNQIIFNITISSFLGIFIGIIGAFLLSINVKKELLGFEPTQMSQLYIEKEGMLEAIHEGVLAIDEDERITLYNESAKKILNIKDDDIIGKKVLEVFPTSQLPEVLKSGEAEYDKEQEMNKAHILANRVPIKDGDKILGAIATFRDRTMMTKLAEEISGTKQVVEALRANTHEFMNKLHVILGLIQLGDIEEAKNYIVNITDNQQKTISAVTNKIRNSKVAALLLGKISRSKEMGIEIEIDEETSLESTDDIIISNALITILGNLVENAMEATAKSNKEQKRVNLKIKESESNIEITVRDTGVGIEEEDKEKIMNRGFSTKKGSQGVGLSLVKRAVESLNGKIDIQSKLGLGTKIEVLLKKGDSNG
ncbi:MAG: ATP-binding protein [Bacillota bacterium]|nr:ATP-binding protein [Bacillota bacterium]